MSDIRKYKMIEAGLELGRQLYQKLWNDFRGDAIGTTIYDLRDEFRRDAKFIKDESVLY